MAARTPDQQCSIPTASISTASPPGGCTREGVALMTAPCSTKIITTAHGDIEQIPTESVALTKRVASTGCCGNSFKPSGPVDICCDPLVRPNPISCGKSVRRLVQSDLVGVACCSPGEARCRERGDSCETGSAPCDEKFEEMGLEPRFAEASLSKEELCPCCLPLILDSVRDRGIAARISSRAIQNDLDDPLLAGIRRCCRIFETICLRKSCCYSVGVSGRPREGTVSETDEASNSLLLSVNPADGAQRTLELALHGMDCPGCANKVMVAARKLDGFRDIHADYIGCRAVLRIDTEIISAEAAVRFITRATGIQATILTDDDHPHGPRTTLPVRFSRPGPNLKLDLARFEQTSWLKVGNHYEVDFDPTCISGREILAHMCDHAPILVKRHEMISESSRARRELMYSALRAAFLISFTLPILVLAWGSFDLPFILRGGLQLGFSVPVMLGSSRIFINSARSVWYLRHADTQLLIAIGTSVAWLFSVSSYVLNLTGTSIENPFFETPTLLLAVVHLGYTIQALALRAGGSIVDALRGLQPDDALLLEGDTAIPIDHRLIHYGDVVRVNTNECVAADGIVISGAGCTDESLITGESKPIEKPIGSTVITGSRNTGSSMDVQVSRLWSESSVERVAGMVRQTQQSRLPVQDLADLIAGVLLPVSIACAALSFVIWTCVSKLIHGTSTSVAIVTGLTYAIAVVAVSCPCALVLTTPLVLTSVLALGVHQGVLFRSATAMWNLPSISTYAFDKTGTLTQGRLSVVSSILRASSASALVSALVHGDSHPIARGISDSLDCDSAAVKDIRDQFGSTEVVLGGGIRTTFRGFPLLGGSAAFTGGDIDILAGSDRASLFLVTLGGWTVAAFALHDVVRPGSAALVAQLKALGRKVMMISGDQIGAVQYTAQQLGIDQDKAFGACSPATKLQLIEQLKTTESVCYIGDGVNDSLALVAADTSIAVSFAVDVAQAAADIVITSKSEDLGHAVFTSLTLATINRWHIKAALSWSVIYNVLAILLASGAFVNIRIQPEWAGLGEIVSVLPVIFIAFAVRITWRLRDRGLEV